MFRKILRRIVRFVLREVLSNFDADKKLPVK